MGRLFHASASIIAVNKSGIFGNLCCCSFLHRAPRMHANWRRHYEEVFDFRRSSCVYGDFGICSDRHRFERILRCQGCDDQKCTIVDKKPTTTTTIVDNGTFKTRSEAETGMKTIKVCTEN